VKRILIKLPKCIADLARAADAVRHHYKSSGLNFTLDGKLVGDIGEVVAARYFGLTICQSRLAGVDALTKNERTVQIKATGSPKKGPAFSKGEGRAQFLIFLYVDFENRTATILYNGLENPVRALLPREIASTKRLSLKRVLELDASVKSRDRLAPI